MTEAIDFDEGPEWAAALMADGWSPMAHPLLNQEVDDHIRRCFGEADEVLHEHLSKYVHLDIHVIRPTRGRTFTTYVTSGMSDLPMKTPLQFPEWARAELVIALPGPPETHIDTFGRRHYLIELMRSYARRPHALGTFYRLGQALDPLGESEPIGPDTGLTACLTARPMLTPIVDSLTAFRATLGDGAPVNFLALEPIYPDEFDVVLKHKRGAEELIERLEEAQVFELYNPERASVARPARGFSLKRLLGG
ncbi:MAG TPA: suppressor of fused domain protein [Caulobacteraceae bacterium]|jgi:hypothetical protein|nr:suppressor of fused domain protein [Caulobacteraceae bacterium]